MTGRTHDLAAFTTLTYIITAQHLVPMSFATALVALGANMMGGIAPDIDQPTAALWNKLPAGSVIGRLLTPLLGGHRLISHSLVGIALFGFVFNWALGMLHSVLLVDMAVVWRAFMIGFVSHLVMDTLTREGVPWLFPIPIRFGFPPFRFLRIKTGGMLEKAVIFPGLLIANIYLFYTYHAVFLDFLRHYIK